MRSFVRNTVILLGVVAATIVPGVASASASTAATPAASSQAALLQKVLANDIPQLITYARTHGTALVEVNPNGTINLAKPSPAGCHYSPTPNEKGKHGEIGNPHRSTSILHKRNVNSTKVNSFIVCSRRVEALSNTTYLFTLAGGKATQRAKSTTNNENESVLANQGTYYDCQNSHKTTWDGAALGESLEGGTVYVGVGYSASSYTWDCGT
jgi:hypothetical protein